MVDVKYANTLLRSFGSELINRLHLKSVAFKVGHEIEFPGKPIKHLFFLEEGMASMTTTFKNGRQVEVGMFGYESVIGVFSFRYRLDPGRAYFSAATVTLPDGSEHTVVTLSSIPAYLRN